MCVRCRCRQVWLLLQRLQRNVLVVFSVRPSLFHSFFIFTRQNELLFFFRVPECTRFRPLRRYPTFIPERLTLPFLVILCHSLAPTSNMENNSYIKSTLISTHIAAVKYLKVQVAPPLTRRPTCHGTKKIIFVIKRGAWHRSCQREGTRAQVAC